MLHRHEAGGFELLTPVGWKLIEVSERGMLLGASLEDYDLTASASITIEAVEPGAQLADLTSRAEARGTASMRPIDRLGDRIGPNVVERVLLHCEREGRAVTVEEWRLLAGDRLVTISAACPTPAYARHADAFAELAHSVHVDDRQRSQGPSRPFFDPARGLLVTTEAGFDIMRALAGGRSPPGEAAAQLEALAACGAVVEGQPHPALAQALEPTIAPLLALSLTRTHETIRAWADAAQACLLVPVGTQGWRRLLQVGPDLLPDALGRLVGLRPTGQVRERRAVEVKAAALARIVAGEQGQTVSAQRLAELPEAARVALAGMRDHWRIEAHRHAVEAGEVLEVIESDQGLWLAVAREDAVELRPTDAATVWRHLSQFTSAAG